MSYPNKKKSYYDNESIFNKYISKFADYNFAYKCSCSLLEVLK